MIHENSSSCLRHCHSVVLVLESDTLPCSFYGFESKFFPNSENPIWRPTGSPESSKYLHFNVRVAIFVKQICPHGLSLKFPLLTPCYYPTMSKSIMLDVRECCLYKLYLRWRTTLRAISVQVARKYRNSNQMVAPVHCWTGSPTIWAKDVSE
jgi:hypothetical protein